MEVGYPRILASGLTVDQIKHLVINFHKLVLAQGNYYIVLPNLVTLKETVINPKKPDENCFE